MNLVRQITYYGLLFLYILGLDRVTKYWALTHLAKEIRVNDILSFDFVINRGVSWSMFHSESDTAFYLLTLVIFGVTLFLASYAYHRWHDNKIIIGEVIVLAGGLSNLIDRLVYQGVIDFIVLGWGPFVWPVFNVADVCIVFGVLLMCISVYRDHD